MLELESREHNGSTNGRTEPENVTQSKTKASDPASAKKTSQFRYVSCISYFKKLVTWKYISHK